MSEEIGYEISLDGLIDGFEQMRDAVEGDRRIETKADQWIQLLRGLNLPGSTKIKVFPQGRVDLDKLDEAKVITVD